MNINKNENKIIGILKENGLYDDERGILDTNEIDDFLKNYKINKSHINTLPKNIVRSDDGFLMIESVPYIISRKEEEGHNLKCWLLFDNGCRALLKNINWIKIQNELLFKYLCNWLDIPCVDVDACYLESTKFLISPSFLGINEKALNYYNGTKRTSLNIKKLMEEDRESLTEYEPITSRFYSDFTKHLDIEQLIKMADIIKQSFFIRKVLLVDILAQNKDRFPRNIKIINGKEGIRICPLFDHEILGINSESLCIEMLPSINDSANYDDIINHLLKDNQFRNWCLEKILLRQVPDFREMIYRDKKIYVDDEVVESFNKTINEGKSIILDNYK